MSRNDVIHKETCEENYKYIFKPDILRGKVAFVTGGGSGICFTVTEIFMRHGCDTIIVGRNFERVKQASETLTAATGRKCLPLSVDVRKPQQILEAVDEAMRQFGKIDILVNGAAGNFLCPLDQMSFNAFRTVMEIDAHGTFNVSKAVYDKSMKTNGGVIINITALLHLRGTMMQTHAGSAKAAIEAMTRHMAVEWGMNGVRVMCVAPGPIADTEGWRRLGGGRVDEEFEKAIPIQRVGLRVDIADVCLFLTTRGSELLTGTTIFADGGSWLTGSNNFYQAKKMLSSGVPVSKARL
ncbi:peroxisomal 2,4-dienoyl-CoA reductase [(3E)-enoyl-CoA-producing]-like [Haliotis rufescens]|uniref:peroxisomal 2,4-dienoyl-CoA reductase [(3E)-enoyl-CoA-producing]-like n=1 Tax=Haliotis rufescens TaxID=6454 RepID=UPI001EB0883A|nr:peroxisomal 2,4-dienoyl-CoA reductase [(3E)-enoyl-CoA-producing]-like [Haliotis rufescens]